MMTTSKPNTPFQLSELIVQASATSETSVVDQSAGPTEPVKIRGVRCMGCFQPILDARQQPIMHLSQAEQSAADQGLLFRVMPLLTNPDRTGRWHARKQYFCGNGRADRPNINKTCNELYQDRLEAEQERHEEGY